MGSWSMHVHFSDICSCLLNCRDLDPAAVDIPVIVCVNLVSWNSFSKDDPLWRERERERREAAAALYLFFPARHHLLKALHSRLSQERLIHVTQ